MYYIYIYICTYIYTLANCFIADVCTIWGALASFEFSEISIVAHQKLDLFEMDTSGLPSTCRHVYVQ